jgi:hypothetical protein
MMLHEQPTQIFAYWSPPDGGPVQMFRMHEMDFQSAQRRFPEQWSLEVPDGAEVVDRTQNRRMFDGLGKN